MDFISNVFMYNIWIWKERGETEGWGADECPMNDKSVSYDINNSIK